LIQSHPFVICEKGRCRSWTTWPPPRSPPRLRTSTPSGLKLSSNWRAPSRRRCLHRRVACLLARDAWPHRVVLEHDPQNPGA
jgi:hypothetical protein